MLPSQQSRPTYSPPLRCSVSMWLYVPLKHEWHANWDSEWPHCQEFWESVSKRPFMCFHLLWSKLRSLRNIRLKKERKGGGGQIWIEIRRKSFFYNLLQASAHLYLGRGDTQPTTSRKRSSKEEKTRSCDQRGDPRTGSGFQLLASVTATLDSFCNNHPSPDLWPTVILLSHSLSRLLLLRRL